MTPQEQRVLADALQRPPDARAALTERLFVSLDVEEEADEAFGVELKHRLGQLDSGQIEAVSDAGFKAFLRKKLDALPSRRTQVSLANQAVLPRNSPRFTRRGKSL